MKILCLVNFLLYSLFITAQNQYQTYTNPVLVPGNFSGTNINSLADPYVLKDTDGTYYMYVTGQGYPCFSSNDLVNWEYETNVFHKHTAKWAVQGFWAPEVIKLGDKYYLHYTAAREDDIKHIGVAFASSPTGPFVDMSNKPFIDNGEKATIDSHLFIDDDGRFYMYYSNDVSTNPIPELGGKKRSEIFVVEIKPDFSGFLSEPVMLIYPQQSWEFNPSSNNYWNEGAVVLKYNGLYYLFFSGNGYFTPNYAVGYATSTSPMGPFTKSVGNPILSNAAVSHAVSGPGHNCVVRSPDDSEWFLVYHSHVHVGNLTSSNNGIRQINIDRMTFNKDGTITVSGPTITPQPFPSATNYKESK
jgi:beta-xylosidase